MVERVGGRGCMAYVRLYKFKWSADEVDDGTPPACRLVSNFCVATNSLPGDPIQGAIALLTLF